MAGDRLSQLDANQVIRRSGVALDGTSTPELGLGVLSVGGTLVPERYDSIDLTYVSSGDGVGEVETATYNLDGNVIATITLSYNSDNKISSVVRS